MVVLHVRNKQEQKEMHYRQTRNIENKMRWLFCRNEISKSKKKWAICKRGTLKIKCDERFANAEQARAKKIDYRQVRNAKSKMQWLFCRCGISKNKRKWTICRSGTLKIKCDKMFADTEQAKAKENALSADAEY